VADIIDPIKAVVVGDEHGIIPPVQSNNERPCGVFSRLYGDEERGGEKPSRRRIAFPDSDEPDTDAVLLKNRGQFMFTEPNER